MQKDKTSRKIKVLETPITVASVKDQDYISLTDMLKAKDGDFFISDWLRNRNTVEFLGIWESVHNPDFNYGGFATIKSQAGLNSYKLSVMENLNAVFINEGLPQHERLTRLNQTAISQMTLLMEDKTIKSLERNK